MSSVGRRSIAHRYLTRAAAATQATTSETITTIDLTAIENELSETIAQPTGGNEAAQNDLYRQLQDLEHDDVIRNTEFIFCISCDHFIDVYDGILVRECLHQICIDCIRKVVIACADVEVKCPKKECPYFLQDREIRSLLTPSEYELHSKKYTLADAATNHNNNNNEKLYEELMKLEEQGVIYNTDGFECEICYSDIEAHDGVIIRDCLHKYCIDCVRQTIIQSEEVQIKCPAIQCAGFIMDREIRSLLTQSEFDKHNLKMLRIAESQAPNSYHCKKANCEGWCLVEDEVNTFKCPRCSSLNCLSCQAIHAGLNCKEYQDDLRYAGMSDTQKTEMHLDEIVRKNEGMRCTTCKIVIMKRIGCDFLICSMCRTELCWATKMSRWGPGGHGDTSGGCGCRPGKRCHPKCRNCH
ncbi:ranBP-type and C3HC4-type zinc finger-containing protein 1-like [Contarinia nasturtii]|uniref:ranBP-type and C3HC4-type zinc finger-containing protein 1-like n=1 Tax=Contarinia nasturtii TaxID=265458 RepID=UPI0012D3FB6F|nr:ranBP-type and C3HC4-type zinc finger-containing protein 1-like [Contarinia nasturtii]